MQEGVDATVVQHARMRTHALATARGCADGTANTDTRAHAHLPAAFPVAEEPDAVPNAISVGDAKSYLSKPPAAIDSIVSRFCGSLPDASKS